MVIFIAFFISCTDSTGSTDTGEPVWDADTETGDALRDADTETGDALRDADTETDDALQDADTETDDALQDRDTIVNIEDIETTYENCDLLIPFLEDCNPLALTPFLNSCDDGMMTGYTRCNFDCATMPLDQCHIGNTLFDCDTENRCENYKACMQICPK